jgi:hypothetical protein
MRTNLEKAIGYIRREFLKRVSASQFREVILKLTNAMEITNGYQDSTGFHFGTETAVIKSRSRRINKFS